MLVSQIEARLAANALPVPSSLAPKLAVYLRLLAEWNQKMDLTAVEGEEEWLDKHFIDSLTVLKTDLIPRSAALIDVGTGAGFPGMVLALAREDLRVTLLDAQQKRLGFLEAVARETGAANVSLVHARAEEGAGKPGLRESFDIAAARAVAPLNVLCEYLLPYVRVGGTMLSWKGPALVNELEAGRRAAFLLGGRIGEPVSCPISGRDWDHQLLPVLKTAKTPSLYPRKPGMPKQHPLGL